MKKALAFMSLFTSVSTLFCCALPALFVVLGFGAAFAGIVGTFPGLLWLSENKHLVFSIGAVLLILSGLFQWRAQVSACPVDANLATSCTTTKDWSKTLYITSVVLYLIGAFFAFIAPLMF